MEDVLGYAGQDVIVTGAASGMGEAATRILGELGASVIAIDINASKIDVAAALTRDLRDRDAIEAVVGPIGRYSTAEEQAWPLVLLGSTRMAYVGGTVLWVDGGWNGALTVGRRTADWVQQTAT